MSCNNAKFNDEGKYNCRNIEIEVIKSDGYEWYKDCIGKRFVVQSESKKGGKGKYVVRLNKEDRHLMNGYNYGWVLKEHCKIV